MSPKKRKMFMVGGEVLRRERGGRDELDAQHQLHVDDGRHGHLDNGSADSGRAEAAHNKLVGVCGSGLVSARAPL